jgi:hypothetical protein
MEKQISIRAFLGAYDAGEFKSDDMQTMIKAGWHDWFCDDSELKYRLDELIIFLRQLLPSPKINQDNCYVWFQNCCPIYGELYDEIRISELGVGGKYLWCIVPHDGHLDGAGVSEVWDIAAMNKDDTLDEAVVTGQWSDVVNFFKPEQ